MTDNMKILIDQVTTAINSEYGDSLPTLEQINDKADTLDKLLARCSLLHGIRCAPQLLSKDLLLFPAE